MRASSVAMTLAFVMAAALGGAACEKREGEIRVSRVDPASGTTGGGDQVTIYGSGFQPGKTQAEVRFGRRKADNVTIASETQITVVTPPGDRGPIDVSVMFEDGKAFKIPEGFRFVEPGNSGSMRKAWEKQGQGGK